MIIKKEFYHQYGLIKGFFHSLKVTALSCLRICLGLHQRLTINYPEKKYFYSDRFRGKPALTIKEDGSLRCNSCMLCVSSCPSKCIHITTKKEKGNISPTAFHIELLRCIFCGICEDVCPIDAIRLTEENNMAGHSEEEWMMDHYQLAWRDTLHDGEGILSVVDDNAPGNLRL